MSESLRSLAKNERMSESLVFFGANRSFTLFFAKNERFAQITDERIPSPGLNVCITVRQVGGYWL